jgi:hypothetical protein
VTATSAVPPQTDVPSAGQCAPITLLALKILADLRTWVEDHPPLAGVPLEAMAMTTAIISPWRSPAELRLPARMCIWTYAFDDHVEQDIDNVGDLDDLLDRCRMIVCDDRTDHGTPLLSALSDWHRELRGNPLYPALAQYGKRNSAWRCRASGTTGSLDMATHMNTSGTRRSISRTPTASWSA